MLCDWVYAVGASTTSKTDFQWRSNEMDRLSFLPFPLNIFHPEIFFFLNLSGIIGQGD